MRRPLVLDESELTESISATFSIGPDGTINHRQTGLSINQRGLKDGIHEFSMDPRDIELDTSVNNGLLGRGACGIVTRAIHTPTQTQLAIKSVKVDDKNRRDQLMTDIQALLRVQECPALVQLYGAFFDKKSAKVHVALELMDWGSLQDLLQATTVAGESIPDDIIANITYQMLLGLEFLHRNMQLHRDLKPGNVLIKSSSGTPDASGATKDDAALVKLSDFGISKALDSTAGICNTFVGTAVFMSPERAVGASYTLSADIWSLGIIVYELKTGKHPYPSMASFPVLFDCLCNRPEPRIPVGAGSGGDCGDFVAKCLQRGPEQRASAEELLRHEWLKGRCTNERLGEWLKRLLKK
jgi:serine/threonine protein kinase